MDKQTIDKICSQVYRQFPEVRGVKPKIKNYSGTSKLLIFNGKVKTADGKSLPRIVRVVVGNNGSIEKITTTR
jgi:hypothetical protein